MEPGVELGHYTVLSEIGRGGMGVVWKARDNKLGREVAIKTLPPEFASDAERLARFEREAKLLASLNHPNIAAIYGLEEQEGTCFLVLELVDGPTLADRIDEGPLLQEEALPLALQIAEALEAAHEKGVIHRDLKPANIKVTKDAKVKILDFGLAKAFAAAPEASVSQSPTLSIAATGQGMILGTAAYMSPEQARGHEVDKRTDIWAFGCVLFELLTGQQAFGGSDVTDILAAVVRATPDWDALPTANPRLKELLQRCLEKDSSKRWRDIGDVRVDIEMAQSGSPAGIAAEDSSKSLKSSLRWMWSLVAAMLVLAATIVFQTFTTQPPASSRTIRFSIDVPSGPNQSIWSGVGSRVTISPDGSRIAYFGTQVDDAQTGERIRRIFVRGLADREATPLGGTEGAQIAFFSPDGEWIAFTAGGVLQKVRVDGGAPLEITPDPGLFRGGGDWGEDDTIVYSSGILGGLARVSASGGVPEIFTTPATADGETSHGHPEILPGGKTVLFTIGTESGSRLASLSLDTGEWQDLGLEGSTPKYIEGGFLVFSQNGNLRVIRFDPDTLSPVGSVLPAEDGIDAASIAGLEVASFDVSLRGDLVFVPGTLGLENEPVWVDRTGQETSIGLDAGAYIGPDISPDGSRFAIVRTDAQGIGEIWVINSDGTGGFPLDDEGANYNTAWTPDGTTLTYTSSGNIFERVVDEEGERQEFLSRANYQMPRSWSPDGEFLAFREESPEGSRIWIATREEEPQPLTSPSFRAGNPQFAPQGGWIAYTSDETDRPEVYVRPYPGTGRAEVISRGGGLGGVWSADGNEFYYRSGDRMMMVEIETEPEFSASEPVVLWSHPYYIQEHFFPNFDVAPDGRFLMLAIPDIEETYTMTVNVVLGWLDELRQRVPE